MAGNRIEITDEIRAKLEAEKERSGIGVRQLMRGRRGEYPEGLRADMVDGWIAGRTATARRDHLDWVLRAWASYTPSEPKKDPGPARIDLSDSQIATLQAEAERTGLGAINILKHAPTPLPKGLNHQKVQRWISGETRTAIADHWELVLSLYTSLPQATEN